MKRAYSKPSLYVESIKLDTPIALNCMVEKADIEALKMFGYFTADRACLQWIENNDPVQWGDNTICYHSNIQTAFIS